MCKTERNMNLLKHEIAAFLVLGLRSVLHVDLTLHSWYTIQYRLATSTSHHDRSLLNDQMSLSCSELLGDSFGSRQIFVGISRGQPKSALPRATHCNTNSQNLMYQHIWEHCNILQQLPGHGHFGYFVLQASLTCSFCRKHSHQWYQRRELRQKKQEVEQTYFAHLSTMTAMTLKLVAAAVVPLVLCTGNGVLFESDRSVVCMFPS